MQKYLINGFHRVGTDDPVAINGNISGRDFNNRLRFNTHISYGSRFYNEFVEGELNQQNGSNTLSFIRIPEDYRDPLLFYHLINPNRNDSDFSGEYQGFVKEVSPHRSKGILDAMKQSKILLFIERGFGTGKNVGEAGLTLKLE